MNDGSMTIPESSLTVVDVDRPEMASAVNELMLLMQAVTEHYSMCIHSATSELLKKVQNSDPIDSAAGIQMREEFDEKILDAAITLDEAAHRDFTTQCGLPEDEFFSDSFTPSDGAKLG